LEVALKNVSVERTVLGIVLPLGWKHPGHTADPHNPAAEKPELLNGA
jgi:hypothetical protein